MIVLANRPGFPFLGNDFFGAMGVYVARCIAHNLSQCNCHTVSLYKHNTDTLIHCESKKLGHFFTAYNFRNTEQIFTKFGKTSY